MVSVISGVSSISDTVISVDPNLLSDFPHIGVTWPIWFFGWTKDEVWVNPKTQISEPLKNQVKPIKISKQTAWKCPAEQAAYWGDKKGVEVELLTTTVLSWANIERQFFETRKKGRCSFFRHQKSRFFFFGCQKKKNFSFLVAKKEFSLFWLPKKKNLLFWLVKTHF